MDKRKKILTAAGAIAALLAIYFVYEHFMYVTTDNAQIEAHALMIAPKVGGYVREVQVEEGQTVKKGDLLAAIDPRDYENTLRQAKGELTSIEARRRDAERNFKRLQDLYAKGAVSQQMYDTASSSFSEIKAKYDAVSAQVDQAQLNLDNTRLIAPADGFIAKTSVEAGQLASPGVPLIGFVSAGERWVIANLKETEIEGVRIGAPVTVSVDAIPGRKFEGKVTSISSATGATFTLLPPDNATGNFTKVVQRVPLKITLQNLSASDVELLKAGLSADVKISKH